MELRGSACSSDLQRWLFELVGLIGPTKQQVERSLIELCAEGYVEGTGELRDAATGATRERVMYAITATGRAELDRWRSAPLPQSYFKYSFSQQYSWFPEDPPTPQTLTAAIAEAERRADRCRATLTGHERIPDERIDDTSRPLQEILRDLNYNHEIAMLEGELRTLTELRALCVKELERLRGRDSD